MLDAQGVVSVVGGQRTAGADAGPITYCLPVIALGVFADGLRAIGFSVGVGDPGGGLGGFAGTGAIEIAAVVHRDQRRSELVDDGHDGGKFSFGGEGGCAVIGVGVGDCAGGPVIERVDSVVAGKAQAGDADVLQQFHGCGVEGFRIPAVAGDAD